MKSFKLSNDMFEIFFLNCSYVVSVNVENSALKLFFFWIIFTGKYCTNR